MSEELQIPGTEPTQEAVEVKVPGGKKPKAAEAQKVDRHGLPDAASIDPTKIHRATLSSTGWVVPAKPEKK